MKLSVAMLWARVRNARRFLLVGGVAFLIDAAIFNLGLFVVDKPLVSKAVAVCVATAFTYVGNRWFTFVDRGKPDGLAIPVFIGVNIVAMLAVVGCVAFSRYVLGYDSILADNVSGMLVGTLVGLVIRYYGYSRLVYVNRNQG